MHLIFISMLFGTWAVLWMAVAMTIFSSFMGAELTGDKAVLANVVIFTMVLSVPTFLTATAGWAWLHRRRRRPTPLGYILMAFLIVVGTHFLVAVPAVFEHFSNPALVLGGLASWATLLVMHGWATVPVALLATALFVWIKRRLSPDAEPPDLSGAI